MKKLMIALCLASLTLGGCVVHQHPKHPHADGDFCPPGQAKKGRC